MLQRFLAPIALLAVAAGAGWQALRADEAADTPPAQLETEPPAGAATPMLSVRRVPTFLQGPEALRRIVDEVRETADASATASCLVVRRGDEVIYDHNPTLPVTPASAEKILVATAALDLLGPDATFETSAVALAAPVDGVVQGDLYIIGGGDPLLMTAEYAGRYDDVQPRTSIEDLADAIVAAGVTEITGGVRGDESRFDDVRYVPSWPPRFTNESQNQTGPLTALSFNDAFESFPADNPANSLAVASADPAEFAAGLLDDLLEARGVVIRGRPQSAIAPLGAVEIASIESPPMTDIVGQMLSQSDNTTAELLLKELAPDGAAGSTAAGAAVVTDHLRSQGFPTSGLTVVDGSGLDAGNRVTCELLTDILLDAGPTSDLIEGMAVAGEYGTLRSRLVGTEAQGRVFAKTGTLLDVSALVGVAFAEDGSAMTFAYVVNADPLPADVLDLQHELALDLVAFPDEPATASLVPLTP